MSSVGGPSPQPVLGLGSLILFCQDLPACVAFYRALGVPLQAEDHGSGAEHFATELGPTHFALFAAQGDAATQGAPTHRSAGSQFFGLTIADLESAVDRALQAGAPLVETIRTFPWGRRALIQDPDGRVVELFEPPKDS